jgi:uncharacterized protein (TIGR00251 family)
MVRTGVSAAPEATSWYAIGDGSVTIEIVARPGVSRRRIMRIDPRGLVIALNSAPEKGKANDELVDFLARELKVARSAITIVRGETSPRKTVRIVSGNPPAIAARLQALAQSGRR